MRGADAFFDEAMPQPDRLACYKVLSDWDFGFIHQVLSFTRVHDESVTNTTARSMDWGVLANLYALKKYGPVFLSGEEYGAHWQRELRRYYRQLARSVLARKGNDYWEYHRARLDEMGEPLRIPKLAGAVAGYLVERISRPRDLITSVAKRSRKRQIP